VGQADKLRAVYAASLADTGLAAAWMGRGEVPSVFGRGLLNLQLSIQVFAVLCFGIVAVPLGLLQRKPRWWGKLLLLACGLSWIAHGAVLPFVAGTMGAHVPIPLLPVLCGGVMLLLAAAHQVIDPSFS